MAEPARLPVQRIRGQRGFTLIEMMVAMAILLLGITSLMAALGGGVQLRRSSEAQIEAAMVADQALLRVQQGIERKPDATSMLELRLPELIDQQVESFPGMHYSVQYRQDPDRPDIVMVEIAVRWLEQAEDVQQRYFRVLPLQEPMRQRVARFLQDHGLPKR